jgi:ferrous iron transport protein B
MSAPEQQPTVASCHSPSTGRTAVDGSPVVALVGAPNVGKSTLFNALTGAHRDVGNWPGTTVEVGRGAWSPEPGVEYDLLDLPGAYSLDPLSPDEALTRALIVGVDVADRPDLVVVVADAGRLARSLYMVAQLLELGQRTVVALTMADVAARRGVTVDPRALSTAIGVPVVAVDPRRRSGAAALATTVAGTLRSAAPAPARTAAGAESFADADRHFALISRAVEAATVEDPEHDGRTFSDKIDRVALAPVIGPLAFLAVMWLVFVLTTTIAAPLQGALDAFFSGPVSDGATRVLEAVGLGGTWVQGLLVDGLIAGVGMLLTFLPLMAIMFALLALLEDSGYMARAAVVTDRTMRAIGLPGRAFLPLIVGFGCNVPAIAATRVLPDARHRILTTLLVPFTSCSARLTVYVLMASIFFPGRSGTVVFILYCVSILFVVVVGLLLRGTLWRTMGDEPLILDLPPYQRPTARLTSMVTWLRLRGFLRTAGGIIVVTVIAVWALQAIPAPGKPGSFGDVPVQNSVYAATASRIAPVFEPAGFGSWTATSALMVGFVAKEAVISSWAQTYATAEPGDASSPGALGDAVRADFAASSDGHTTAAVWAFLVFLLAYTPCVATLAAQRREVGLRWTVFGVAMQLSIAWLVAVAVFQIGSRLV